MLSALSTALTALNADSTAVDMVSNNLANMNTTGFKASTASFQDLVAEAISGTRNEPGFGVAPLKLTQNFTQGSIQPTTGPFDAAIEGDGFFVTKDPQGNQLFTRGGSFQVDKDGHLLTASGDKVQGWNAGIGDINTAGPTSDITIPASAFSKPVPTTNFDVQLNLDASQPVGATGASFSTTIQVFDSLGATHNVQLDFQKTDVNTWSYSVSVPGADLTSGTAGTPSQVASGSLTFDSQGNLLTPAAPPSGDAAISIPVTGLSDGAADLTMDWNIWNTKTGTAISNLSQVAQPSAASSPTQDGVAASQIAKLSIGDHGQILAQYTGSQPKVVGQLALAQIINPNTLAPVGNGSLRVSVGTGLPSIGVPATGGRGDIVGGALESSTVDIAREFTNLIVYQRSYEANGKVITTADQLSQTTIQLKN